MTNKQWYELSEEDRIRVTLYEILRRGRTPIKAEAYWKQCCTEILIRVSLVRFGFWWWLEKREFYMEYRSPLKLKSYLLNELSKRCKMIGVDVWEILVPDPFDQPNVILPEEPRIPVKCMAFDKGVSVRDIFALASSNEDVRKKAEQRIRGRYSTI